jgi:hypothetical protein
MKRIILLLALLALMACEQLPPELQDPPNSAEMSK